MHAKEYASDWLYHPELFSMHLFRFRFRGYRIFANFTNVKPFLLFFLSFLSAWSASGQQTTYFDAHWEKTTQEKAVYYGTVTLNDNGSCNAKDYYISGTPQMSGQYRSAAKKIKEGVFTYFHENGKISSEGGYKNNFRIGEWKWYYPNGQLKEAGSFHKNGQKTGPWKGWTATGSKDYEGPYKRDEMHGSWNWYHFNGQKSAVEKYLNGTLLESRYFTLSGAPCTTADCGDQMPSYKGGEDAFFRYIKNNLTYPDAAKSEDPKPTGTVQVRFLIKASGAIDEITIQKSIHPILDREVERVIREMPYWNPGKKHNRTTSFYMELPFYF